MKLQRKLRLRLAEAGPILREAKLQRATTGDGEALHTHRALAQSNVPPLATRAEGKPRQQLHRVHCDPLIGAGLDRAHVEVGPRGARRHGEKPARGAAAFERERRIPIRVLNFFGNNHRDRHAHERAALGRIGIGAHHFGEMHAGFEAGGIDFYRDALGIIGEQDLAGVFHPVGIALEPQTFFKIDFLRGLCVPMENGNQRH